jgi:solute carrier family 25 (mitochondrial adenine nucleotide translocator), member 4/5/6/31
MAPLERVKLVKQLGGINGSSLQIAKHIYTTQGLQSFWKGNLPSVMRVSGTAAINFVCLDYYKKVGLQMLVNRKRNHSDTTAATTATAAATVSGTATTQSQQQAQQRTLYSLSRTEQITASLISGGLAGATSTSLLYPLEFVRTRLALDMHHGLRGGTRNLVSHILRTDGTRGLYQGYGIALFGGIYYRLLYLGGYDAWKSQIDTSVLPFYQRFAVAQIVSLTAGTASYPLDSVRRRMMMQAGKQKSERLYKNSIDCIRQVYATQGLRGFFLGLGPNLVRSVGGALFLVAYDSVRVML